VITGFHFLSAAEEIFVLESRLDDRERATVELGRFFRHFPSSIHVLANPAGPFPAPRKYCCLDRLLKRIEIPISLDQLLQVRGLYFRAADNHRLFPIARKLADLTQCESLAEADQRDAFPTYADLRCLMQRAVGLYAMPLLGPEAPSARRPSAAADFGESPEDGPFTIDTAAVYVPVGGFPASPDTTGRERLTNFVLTRPLVSPRHPRRHSECESPAAHQPARASSARTSGDTRRERRRCAAIPNQPVLGTERTRHERAVSQRSIGVAARSRGPARPSV
jgi:hypothetical protein